MKKSDEQLANELDLFLTARINGQPLPTVSEELLTDITFVDSLLETAVQVKPKALILSDTWAHQTVSATQQRQKTSTQAEKTNSIWENLISYMRNTFTMKRTIFALGTVTALFVIAFMAWTTFQNGRPDEPGAIVESTTEPTPSETTEPTIIADLPILPSLSSASGLGGGFGGGGNGDAASSSGDAEIGIRFFNPLSGTQFILNTTLPLELTSATVYQQPPGPLFSLEDVPGLAAVFGMNGPIYNETYLIEEGSGWTPSPVYQLFDGTRTLAVGENYLYYYDDAGTVFNGNGNNPMPFEQAVPIADAFLQQTGLADFEYRLLSLSGIDIEVRRIINGREVIYPEFQMAVNDQGHVWSFSYNPLNQLSALGEYPLRSAESAWQYLLDKGVDFQTVFFNSYPEEAPLPQPPVNEEDYRDWQRTYEPGQEVTLYSYPVVFSAVNGDAPPRITLDMFTLNGAADQLEAIAEYAGRQILVQGIVGEADGFRQPIELVSWEPIEKEYSFREGTIQISEGQGILQTLEGESLIIPDVPTNLFDGEKIYVSGWIDSGNRGQDDIFNWQSMSIVVEQPEFIEGEPEPLPLDGELANPFGINEVTINQATIQYAVLTEWDDATQTATFFLQPVWQFKGLTDSGDIIDIYVQAIDDEYLAPPVQ